MIAFLLLASTTLFDQAVTVSRAQTRGMRLEVNEIPATLEVAHEVRSGKSGVRVVLLDKDAYERFERGKAHEALAATGYRAKGQFRHYLTAKGEYRVLIDNTLEGRTPAEVHIRITLTPQAAPRTLPAAKRRAAVFWSLFGFCAVGGLSGWKLVSAVRSRRRRGRTPPYA